MSKMITLLAVPLVAASLAAPLTANTAEQVSVSCSVTVDYLLNNAAVESYQKAFVVKTGVSFNDDFSTGTREKTFDASLVLDAGKPVVGISYFNDVGLQDNIDFNTKLVLHDKGTLESTSGDYTFTTTFGSIPQRQHTVNYTLTCKQAK